MENLYMNENMENKDSRDSNEIMSSYIRCGKRTYFFDLKASKRNEIYLTLTESKRRFNDSNGFFYEKHKIFVLEQDLKNIYLELGKVIKFIEANPHLENTVQDIHVKEEEQEEQEEQEDE